MIKNKLSVIISAIVNNTIIISILVLTMTVLFYRFRFDGTGCLSAFEDDFFYYLKIAENIYYHGFSSFNNIYQTNGYQPLWFLIILGLLFLCKGPTILFFVSTVSVIFISIIFIFYFSQKLLSRFIDNRTLALSLASFASFLSLLLSFGAMEVHLAILMMLIIIQFIIARISNLDDTSVMLKLGFFSSILVLSRLDSFLFIFLLLLAIATVNCHSLIQYLKRIVLFSIGGLMVPAYLIFNIVNFETLMPISGMAKQLKTSLYPSTQYLTTMLILARGNIYTQTFIATTISVTILGLVLGIILFIKNINRPLLKIFLPCLLFPFLFMAMHSELSDFGIWAWYLYPWIISFVIGLIIIYTSLQRHLVRIPANYSLVIAIACIFFFINLNVKYVSGAKPEANMMYEAGKKISTFLINDPHSIVAIGDRGGIVSYLLPNSVIQLEGLVMDREFLQHISNQDNLIDVLNKYKVKYYITYNPIVDKNGCYFLREPQQGGQYTKRMTGSLCQKPVHEFTLYNIRTIIFKL